MTKFQIIFISLFTISILSPSKIVGQLPLTHNNNLRVDNDDWDGCDYYVTPLAGYSHSCAYNQVMSLRTLVLDQTSHYFSRADLDNAAGVDMYYVGLMVEGPNGNLFVYCDAPTNEVEDPGGNCDGADLILYYDYTAVYGPSLGEVDIMN